MRGCCPPLVPTVMLLWRHIAGETNTIVRVDQVQLDRPIMSGESRIGQLEWLQPVLQDAGECDQSPLRCRDRPRVLVRPNPVIIKREDSGWEF